MRLEQEGPAPPVKVACLSRSLKTRCDGERPCRSCQTRGRDCSYRPSRRGGARVRKPREKTPTEIALENMPQQQLPLERLIEPGAGLRQFADLYQDSDFIFENLFPAELSELSDMSQSPVAPLPAVPMVRTYQSNEAIIDAYYIYIHPFFPILPAPNQTPIDRPVSHLQGEVPAFEPASPLGLAISAVLTLIPCADDMSYQTTESVLFRRMYAQYFAQSAIECIENENEMPETIQPSEALALPRKESSKQRFHAQVPQELEDIIALNILSFYEYAQRGNLKKMQARAGQALMSALALSLNNCEDEDEDFAAKSRVWWMTYICVTQATIVSNSQTSPLDFNSSFKTKYPLLECDHEAFELFVQAQRTVLACTCFAVDLVRAVKANSDISIFYERMKGLEYHVESLNIAADAWILQGSTSSPVDRSEQVVSRALRCIARIKLGSARIKIHRYCAFFDNPVFAGKYCDLDSVSCVNSSTSSSILLNSTSGLSEESKTSVAYLLPFSRQESTEICLKAALTIAATFNDLPFPNPTGEICESPCYLAPMSLIVAPRLMPSLACCAMQCTYTLAMINNRTVATLQGNTGLDSDVADGLLMRVRMGFSSIFTVFQNYATAFEALGGMRDQVQNVI
ncbi:hypothetical protein BT63DRAFT_90673 [Microthyrium microscopicum]|uniref:Zn(2)-C6 fungal-type domain-containing protein n=1 Tax=Microthyrium microscopicum TaxID=703497 RepID=A0A6A6TZR6_9PEZI|nr:hypothetical protein BT63DRAFT_90673 [Microthyrium microscopicum]